MGGRSPVRRSESGSSTLASIGHGANLPASSVVTVAEMRGYAAAGMFASGSMLPKVEAACLFAGSGRGFAVITSLGRIEEALAGKAGTIVTA